MNVLQVAGVKLAGVRFALPKREVDNRETCQLLFGDKAESILKTSGILKRRVADKGETSLGLSCQAAEELLETLAVDKTTIGGVVAVSFTPELAMPGNAQLAQARLGLGNDVAAIDLNHACAGYPYGLYVAASLVRDLQKPVLLLDGDVQTPYATMNTAAILGDAGSATLLVPNRDSGAWEFAFYTDGSRAGELKLDGKLVMDGFGVFRFVAIDVVNLIAGFMQGRKADLFVPHQANVYMARELARKLDLADRLAITGDKYGNLASASVAVGLAEAIAGGFGGKALLAGFGGGLSAGVALIDV